MEEIIYVLQELDFFIFVDKETDLLSLLRKDCSASTGTRVRGDVQVEITERIPSYFNKPPTSYINQSEQICKMNLEISALGDGAQRKVLKKIDDLSETLKKYTMLCSVDASSLKHDKFFYTEGFCRTKSPHNIITCSYSVNVYFCLAVSHFLRRN